ncbi:unnamed protein product, partial [Meganyctiphanes norvegica]
MNNFCRHYRLTVNEEHTSKDKCFCYLCKSTTRCCEPIYYRLLGPSTHSWTSSCSETFILQNLIQVPDNEDFIATLYGQSGQIKKLRYEAVNFREHSHLDHVLYPVVDLPPYIITLASDGVTKSTPFLKIKRIQMIIDLYILFNLFMRFITSCYELQKSSISQNAHPRFSRSYGDIQRLASVVDRFRSKWSINIIKGFELQCCGMNDWRDWKEQFEVNEASHTEENHSQDSTETRNKREAKVELTTQPIQSNFTAQPEYISKDVLERLPSACFGFNNTKTEENLYTNGCRDEAKKRLNTYNTFILMASIGVSIILVFSFGITLWLLRSVKKSFAYNYC